MHDLNREAGLTLIELMVTLAVMAIVLTIGIPGLQSHIKDNRQITQINGLVSGLNLARSEATKSNSAVALCASSDGLTCTGGFYDNGWIVFSNTDNDNPPAVDSGELVLRSSEGPVADGTSLRATGSIAGGINFTSSGRPATFGDITYCDDRGAAYARSVTVNLVGIIRASDKHADGSELTCP
jgi:type IV fimbrial biogenesis protein FimT